MTAHEVRVAFEAINTQADALASRALSGETADALTPERDALYGDIATVLSRVSPEHEIIDRHALRRMVSTIAGTSVEYARRHAVIRAAVEHIAQLEAKLVEIVEPPERRFYGSAP